MIFTSLFTKKKKKRNWRNYTFIFIKFSDRKYYLSFIKAYLTNLNEKDKTLFSLAIIGGLTLLNACSSSTKKEDITDNIILQDIETSSPAINKTQSYFGIMFVKTPVK